MVTVFYLLIDSKKQYAMLADDEIVRHLPFMSKCFQPLGTFKQGLSDVAGSVYERSPDQFTMHLLSRRS